MICRRIKKLFEEKIYAMLVAKARRLCVIVSNIFKQYFFNIIFLKKQSANKVHGSLKHVKNWFANNRRKYGK